MSSSNFNKVYETATTSKRIMTSEQVQERRDTALRAALKGSILGLSLGAAGVLIAHRAHPGFRALAPSVKALIVGSSTIAGAISQAESASLALERKQFGYADESHITVAPVSSESQTSIKNSAIEWINERRWAILGGTWTVAMVGSLAYSFSNRYLNTQQKLVQARMYAQAVTIIALMLTAGISIAAGDEDKKKIDQEDARLRQILELPTTPTKTHH